MRKTDPVVKRELFVQQLKLYDILFVLMTLVRSFIYVLAILLTIYYFCRFVLKHGISQNNPKIKVY